MNSDLTPIENFEGVLVKRDDYHSEGYVNGGKLRQAEYLIKNRLGVIKRSYHNTVVCYCSIDSPQSAIISQVAKKYGLRCIILCYKTERPNINLSIAQKNGAEIYGISSGYNSVLFNRAKENFRKYYIVNMGFEGADVFSPIIEQVRNLPDDLDYLVIPVGSAMNFIGILKGLDRFNKFPKNIVGVYVGRKPHKIINKYYYGSQVFSLVRYYKPYNNKVKIKPFDPIYEAKAFDWIKKEIDVKKNKVLLWVVGVRNTNRNLIEKIKYKGFKIK